MEVGKLRSFKSAVFVGALLMLSLGLPFAFPTLAQTSTETSTPSDTAPPPLPTLNPYLVRDVEAKVRTAFVDLPVMIAIAKCESGFRQFTDAGNVLRGGLGGQMIGVFQFHNASHMTKAAALGYDIETLDGNVAYARYLYTQAGTDPWISSFDCWNSTIKNTGIPANADLRFGMENQEVLLLQQQLNRAGFVLASSGPGSPGNETMKFGNLTRAAVRRFQCAQAIACSGDEYTTGYGLAGERTEAALLAAQNSPAPPQANQKAAEITRLQAQIAELIKLVVQLQAQLALAKNH